MCTQRVPDKCPVIMTRIYVLDRLLKALRDAEDRCMPHTMFLHHAQELDDDLRARSD